VLPVMLAGRIIWPVILDTQNQPLPWWIERLLIPAVFLLLGSVITFMVGQFTTWWNRRKAKFTFLRAVRLELLGLREQLEASLTEVEGSKQRLERGTPAPPQLVGTLRTTVFTSQLATVSDLSDETIIKVIQFYSDLPVILQMIETLNRNSAELSKDDGSAQQAQRVRGVLSIVITLGVSLAGFIKRIHDLVGKLPE